MKIWSAMRMGVLVTALALVQALAGGPAWAAPEPERVSAVLEAVDYGSRRIQAGGVEYGLSSTVVVRWTNGVAVGLSQLPAGVRVRLELEPDSPAGAPVVRRITLLPD